MGRKHRTVRQKCLDDLRKGISPSEVRKKHKSDSAYAASLQDFIAEKEPVAEKIQELYQTQNTLNADVKLKTTQKQALYKQIVDDNKLIMSSQRTLEDQAKNIRKNTALLDNIKAQYEDIMKNLQEFKNKGISLTLIRRIGELEVKTGADLLSRVLTELAYNNLKQELDTLKTEKAKLEKDVSSAKKRLHILLKDINTQKNLVNTWELTNFTIQEANKIVIEFFSDGYTTDDLYSLRLGLNVLAIKDKPGRSIQQLIRYFEKATSLTLLNNFITEKEMELQTITSNLAQAKGEFNAFSETFLEGFEDVKKKGVNQIKAISIQTELESQIIKNVAEQLLSTLGNALSQQYNTLIQTAINSFKNAELTANSITATLDEATKAALAWIQTEIIALFKQCKEDIVSWRNEMYELNDLKDQLRDYELLGSYAKYFLGFLKLPEIQMKEIPLPIIAQFMDRIYVYTHAVFPDAKAFPSAKVNQLSLIHQIFGGNLYTNSEYKLSALALFLAEEFTKRSKEANKDAS